MRTPARLALAVTLAAGFALALAPTAAIADTSDFTFDAFNADYTLSREADGTSTLLVVETIVARFPDFDQNRGIIRAIPDDYDGVPLNTSVVSVTDQTGEARYPSFKGIMAAKKKPVTTYTLADLGIDAAAGDADTAVKFAKLATRSMRDLARG